MEIEDATSGGITLEVAEMTEYVALDAEAGGVKI